MVFVARDSELNREVALKEIKEKHADDPARRSRFLLEAEITGGLEHPGIVPVYGLGTYDDGRPYYAMRFIRGNSLRDAIAQFHTNESLKTNPGARTLELQKLLRRFLDVCNAIEYAHSRGVLHRDLKPDNVMVGRYGETLVVDWGLAKSVARPEGDYPEAPLTPASSGSLAETQPGTAVGTPAYMSPEQAEGRFDLLGPSSDVYSLGGKFYTLLTGRPPVVGKDMAEVIAEVQAGRFPRPREHARWLDPALEAICLKAMALKPSDRYKTPTALAKDIERWIADEPTEAYREPWTLLARRWTKKHRTAVTAAAVAMVVALVGSGAITAVQTRANGVIKQQRNRAEDREAQAIAAVKRFGDVIANDPTLKQTPDLEDLRNRLLNEPRAFFRALRERLQSDHEVAPNRWSDSPRPATNWAS